MEFNNLSEQYKLLKENLDNRIANVLSHGKFIMGPEVTEFEERLATYLNVKSVISCANGTDALQLALMAIDTGPGDAVFTSAFTFTASAEPIALLGATPIFVDIDPVTLNICPKKLEKAISNVQENSNLRPKALIAVDLFGYPASYDDLSKICAEQQICLIEDAAQSMGASYKNRKCGSLGDIGTTSFFPSKPLGCYGDGGAVFCNDLILSNKIKSLRMHGKGVEKYQSKYIGINSRLDTIQAAVLLEKLEQLDIETAKRNQIAQKYQSFLPPIIRLPTYLSKHTCAYSQFACLIEKELRSDLLNHLNSQGIPTQIYYPSALSSQEAYSRWKKYSLSTKISESVSLEIFSLPFSPYLTAREFEHIISEINTYLENSILKATTNK